MKLDPTFLRYMTKDEFRVLTAVEIGQKNHEIVPIPLITSISNLRHGGVNKFLVNLLRHKLLHHETKHFDGFRLTNLGYDYLALKTLLNRKNISGIGRQIGVGKESDIFLVHNDLTSEDEQQLGDDKTEIQEFCLKIHRLGRTSFRSIKRNRDYHKHRNSPSWLYLSRLAAQKEFEFMKVLHENKFPVPEPLDQNRHCVLMSLVKGFTLNTVQEVGDVDKLYRNLMFLIERFARHGLIHGDYNEFNLMIDEQERITVIDFPQMISIDHRNAKMYFERDVNCIRRFFRKRFDYVSDHKPVFEEVFRNRLKSLDVEVQASGFIRGGVQAQNDELADHFESLFAEESDAGVGEILESDSEGESSAKKSGFSSPSEVDGIADEADELRRDDNSEESSVNISDGPKEYENAEHDVNLGAEKNREEAASKDRVDNLRRIVRREIKRSNVKTGEKKAIKMSRNQVKMRSRRDAKAMATFD